MTGKFLIKATVAAGFWRCGRHFTESGIVVDADDFSADRWERLKAEVKLRIEEASDEDTAALKERLEKIAAAITTFSAKDFQRDGKPKLDILNARLGEELGKISGAERDQVWTGMKDEGFEAPPNARSE